MSDVLEFSIAVVYSYPDELEHNGTVIYRDRTEAMAVVTDTINRIITKTIPLNRVCSVVVGHRNAKSLGGQDG